MIYIIFLPDTRYEEMLHTLEIDRKAVMRFVLGFLLLVCMRYSNNKPEFRHNAKPNHGVALGWTAVARPGRSKVAVISTVRTCALEQSR